MYASAASPLICGLTRQNFQLKYGVHLLMYTVPVYNTDLTRQYKTMQSEMALRIHMLGQTVNKLREQLGRCFLNTWDLMTGFYIGKITL